MLTASCPAASVLPGLQFRYSDLVEEVLQPAVSRMLASILPAVKLQTAREILEITRVYACTVDSTPRMAFELEAAGVRGLGLLLLEAFSQAAGWRCLRMCCCCRTSHLQPAPLACPELRCRAKTHACAAGQG